MVTIVLKIATVEINTTLEFCTAKEEVKNLLEHKAHHKHLAHTEKGIT